MTALVLEGRGTSGPVCNKIKASQGFASAFSSDPCGKVGEGTQDAVSPGGSHEVHERQLDAWTFFFQALKSSVDEAIFRRHKSPRACWGAILDWYDTKRNAQRNEKMYQLPGFKFRRHKNTAERFYMLEELGARLSDAGT